MRQIREGEVPFDGGTALQEDPDRPAFHGNGPDDYVCVECGNVLAVSMNPEQMTYKVRVRCGRCRTVNVGDDRRAGTRLEVRRTRSATSADRLPAVGGLAVPVHRGDPDDGRMAHRGRAEVEQRIVVRALPLHAAESEALGG